MNTARIDVDHQHALRGLIHRRSPWDGNELIAVTGHHVLDAAAISENKILNRSQPRPTAKAHGRSDNLAAAQDLISRKLPVCGTVGVGTA